MIALGRRDVRARAALTAAGEVGAGVVVSAVVVAETVRGHGGRDAPVNRVLDAAGNIAPAAEDRARTAGALLARAKSTAASDALVVAVAIERGGGVVLTGDADDLGALAAQHRELVIQPL